MGKTYLSSEELNGRTHVRHRAGRFRRLYLRTPWQNFLTLRYEIFLPFLFEDRFGKRPGTTAVDDGRSKDRETLRGRCYNGRDETSACLAVAVYSDGPGRSKQMAETDVLGNQKMILENQAMIKDNQKTILANQATIQKNQATIEANQDKLEKLLANQATIQANQDKILANQEKILAK
jgi:hypothetical protein